MEWTEQVMGSLPVVPGLIHVNYNSMLELSIPRAIDGRERCWNSWRKKTLVELRRSQCNEVLTVRKTLVLSSLKEYLYYAE